ncbi:hypothetical protein EEB15_13515 [Ramlibacter sp. WS9]|nr:hypothetical protein EEB15_13515 [Ramlibacter sp. WS9]
MLQAHDYRQALVRLWVLGSVGPRLNDWEQARGNDAALATATSQFLSDLEREIDPALDRIHASPLALVRALDDYVAATDARYNRASRGGREALARQENGNDYWLMPVTLQARRLAMLNRQVGNLGAWVRRHVVLPVKTANGLRVELSFSQSRVNEALADLWGKAHPELKVWIGHFEDGADVKWAHNGIKWRTTQVEPQDKRMESILATLSDADAAGAHVVVLPEFTLDLEHRRMLVKRLRTKPSSALILLVAGSFHEPAGDQAFNTAPVYNARGRTVLTHRKLRLFGDLEIGAEDVSVGDSIHVLATPVGCMTVLICKDFMDSHPSVESLLTEIPVEWVLVPSFGGESTIRAHKASAKALAQVKTGAHSVIAQTLNTAEPRNGPPQECVRGFGHAGGQRDPQPQVGEQGGAVTFGLAPQTPVVLSEAPRPSLKRVK